MAHRIVIPTNQSFLQQWHQWVHQKVARHFKRDRDRISDTAQNVRLRLLSKDFIGRWFFKHLSHEVVDLSQAQLILGGRPITFISSVSPVSGPRSCAKCQSGKGHDLADPKDMCMSLWKIADLLTFAKFDYRRYYYSVQGHTISSEDVLALLGEPPDRLGVLESLYRQGRLRPSELTEHECTDLPLKAPAVRSAVCSVPGCGRKHFSRGFCSRCYGKQTSTKCLGCEHGRKLLRDRGISLASRWGDPAVAPAVRKLRWNDRQLKEFLRGYKDTNGVKCPPRYVVRNTAHGIDAGLLRYAEMVIDHEVVNDFKRIARADDTGITVFNNGLSPEMSDVETVGWESDETEEGVQRVIKDSGSLNKFKDAEIGMDLKSILDSCGLDSDESKAVLSIDMEETSTRDYAKAQKIPLQKAQKSHASALKKLKDAGSDGPDVDFISQEACRLHGCTMADILGPAVFGPPVRARTFLFASLYDAGMSIDHISARFGVDSEMVVRAVNRQVLSDMRSDASPLVLRAGNDSSSR